jgi:hypothetical protein
MACNKVLPFALIGSANNIRFVLDGIGTDVAIADPYQMALL